MYLNTAQLCQLLTPYQWLVTQRMNIHYRDMQLQSDSCPMEPIPMIYNYSDS